MYSNKIKLNIVICRNWGEERRREREQLELYAKDLLVALSSNNSKAVMEGRSICSVSKEQLKGTGTKWKVQKAVRSISAYFGHSYKPLP